MLEYYDKEISGNYTISVMDKNIVMETINEKQYVDIFKKDDEITYKIINA